MNARLVSAAAVLFALSPSPDAQCRITELIASDPVEYAWFGLSIDLDGNRLVVGAPTADHLGLDTGVVYLFEETSSGWTETQRIVASDYVVGADFGYSVALDGDWMVIGAPFADPWNILGKVYFFEETPAGFVERASFLSTAGGFVDRYGWSVALDDDVAAVGLPGHSQVIVFERVANTWIETAALVPFGVPTGQWLMGTLVAIEGDRILTSSDTQSSASAGSAFLFQRAGGVWVNEAQLMPSDGVNAHGFGSGIALFGDMALVGAASDPHLAHGAGSAYLFEKAQAGWREAAKITASDAAVNDYFGVQVAFSGDRMLVLAAGEEGTGSDLGAVYLFERSGTEWQQRSKILSNNPLSDFATGLGASMALDGNRAWISDSRVGAAPNAAGAVYEYDLRSTGTQECLSTTNSTGSAASLTVSGCPSILENELLLIAAPVPNDMGLFLYATGSLQAPFGDGFLCVDAPVYRLDPSEPAANTLMTRLDLSALPPDALPITAGVTRVFQAWFRDAAQGGSGFNSSDARSITFEQ